MTAEAEPRSVAVAPLPRAMRSPKRGSHELCSFAPRTPGGTEVLGARVTVGIARRDGESGAAGQSGAAFVPTLSRTQSLPASRYDDVLSGHTAHTAWIGNIPDSCATEDELRELFRGHGITVLRAVISDCPDEHDDGEDDDGSDAESDVDDGATDSAASAVEEQGTDWWALVLFGSKDNATKARNTPIQAATGYGGDEVTLRVEMVQLKGHLRASLDSDGAWAAGSREHDSVATRKGNLLAGAWREMCTVCIDTLSQHQADEQRLHEAFGVFGELLEVISHEPTDRHRIGLHLENTAQCYWALLRFHHPESAGRAMTTDVQQSGNDSSHDVHMHIVRPAGLWHTERWRKLNNHRQQKTSWGKLAYSEQSELSVRSQKLARSRSPSRMAPGNHYNSHQSRKAMSLDEQHARENEEDDAVAYNDEALSKLLASQHSDPDHEMYQPNAAEEVFAVLRRRPPTSQERHMQDAVGGARGQPMYLCKFTNSWKYEWVSYHILSHSVVGMGLVHEFEDRLHAVEQQEVVTKANDMAEAEAEREMEEAREMASEVAAEAARQAMALIEADRDREIEEAAPVIVGPRAALLIEVMRFGRPQPKHIAGKAPKPLWPDLDQSLDDVEEELQMAKGVGNVLGAMELMELAVALRAVEYGVEEDPRHCREEEGCVGEESIAQLVVLYNTAAVEALAPGQFARDTLWKAELLCAELKLISRSKAQTKLRATTLNNLACCYRGMGQPHAALKYWKQTLGLQEGLSGSALEFQRAGTHLNLAELYASTRYHHGSVRHAQTAIAYLLRRFELGPEVHPAHTAGGHSTGGEDYGRSSVGLGKGDIKSLEAQATSSSRKRKLALLVAAFDRLAASLRGLRRRAEASLANQTAAALRAALMGMPAEQESHRPESLPALGRSDNTTISSSLGAATPSPKLRRSSTGVIAQGMAQGESPPAASIALPVLQRHRFP